MDIFFEECSAYGGMLNTLQKALQMLAMALIHSPGEHVSSLCQCRDAVRSLSTLLPDSQLHCDHSPQ